MLRRLKAISDWQIQDTLAFFVINIGHLTASRLSVLSRFMLPDFFPGLIFHVVILHGCSTGWLENYQHLLNLNELLLRHSSLMLLSNPAAFATSLQLFEDLPH